MPQPIILDGGMSRELIRLNAPFRQPEWSALAVIEAPHLVRQVHHEFIVAGAEVVTTNSYALVPFHIGDERFWERGQELSGLAGKLAREAAHAAEKDSGRKVLVAGSLPPVFGSYQPERFRKDEAGKYLDVLVRGSEPYVDIWLGETLSLIDEAKAVVDAVRGTGKRVWIAFTIADEDSDDGYRRPRRLRGGETVTEAVGWAVQSGKVEALLFNCSRPEVMKAAVRGAVGVARERGSKMKLGVYANAFEQSREDAEAANVGISETRKDLGVEKYTIFAREWVREGASIVGGCCGIGIQHIRSLADAFQERGERQ